MIIKYNKIVYSFKYSEIIRIYKENNTKIGRRYSNSQEYLHIVTNDNDFKVLIASTILVGEDFKDISDYLIEKNQNIRIDETINNTKIDILRR